MGCDFVYDIDRHAHSEFQFTHPVWGATISPEAYTARLSVSIHAPRVGCDNTNLRRMQSNSSFNSRTPCGVRLSALGYQEIEGRVSIHAPRVGCDYTAHTLQELFLEFQFTHPVWGATQPPIFEGLGRTVSIHAPRVGCDLSTVVSGRGTSVSIHAPRVGCDRTPPPSVNSMTEFQFTHPVWGATAMPKGTHK